MRSRVRFIAGFGRAWPLIDGLETSLDGDLERGVGLFAAEPGSPRGFDRPRLQRRPEYFQEPEEQDGAAEWSRRPRSQRTTGAGARRPV